MRDSTPVKFILKYDLLIWDLFYRYSTKTYPVINSNIVYPKVLILAPDWFTCENTYKHLSNVNTDLLKTILMCCIYEGQNIETELYRQFLTQGCDLLIATPTIVNDLIQKRHIHFEQLQLIVVRKKFTYILEEFFLQKRWEMSTIAPRSNYHGCKRTFGMHRTEMA